jgi:hypothetical protein
MLQVWTSWYALVKQQGVFSRKLIVVPFFLPNHLLYFNFRKQRITSNKIKRNKRNVQKVIRGFHATKQLGTYNNPDHFNPREHRPRKKVMDVSASQ